MTSNTIRNVNVVNITIMKIFLLMGWVSDLKTRPNINMLAIKAVDAMVSRTKPIIGANIHDKHAIIIIK
jgi:hypothetical protein